VRATFALWLIAGCGRIGFDGASVIVGDGQVGGDGPVDPSLLAWYPMDDDPSLGARDTSGYHRDAACNPACATSTTGVHGGAFAFDGSACLEIPADPALDLFSGSFAAWVRLTSPVVASSIFSRPYQEVLADSAEVFVDSGPQVWADADAISPNSINRPYFANIDMWTHIVLYVNGVELGASGFETAFDSHLWRIGCDVDNGALIHQTQGDLDDVRLYSRVLGASEIATLATP
jgi:hypothetical protein